LDIDSIMQAEPNGILAECHKKFKIEKLVIITKSCKPSKPEWSWLDQRLNLFALRK